MLVYDNEYQTKKNQVEPRTKLNYNIYSFHRLNYTCYEIKLLKGTFFDNVSALRCTLCIILNFFESVHWTKLTFSLSWCVLLTTVKTSV